MKYRIKKIVKTLGSGREVKSYEIQFKFLFLPWIPYGYKVFWGDFDEKRDSFPVRHIIGSLEEAKEVLGYLMGKPNKDCGMGIWHGDVYWYDKVKQKGSKYSRVYNTDLSRVLKLIEERQAQEKASVVIKTETKYYGDI